MPGSPPPPPPNHDGRGSQQPQAGRIVGDCGFQAGGRLIKPLRLLPDRILRSAAGVVNKRILSYAETVFLSGLATEFWEWYDDEQRERFPPLALPLDEIRNS